MAQRSTAVVLLVASITAALFMCVNACMFANLLGPQHMPDDEAHAHLMHNSKARQLQAVKNNNNNSNPYIAPFLPIWDWSNTSIPFMRMADGWGDNPYPYWTAEFISNVSREVGQDMCYWSMQSLANPPIGYISPGPDGAGYCNPSPCQFDPKWYNRTDLKEVISLAALASKRWGQLIKPGGPVQWGGCALGRYNVLNACRAGLLKGEACSKAHRQQESMHALASAIIRFNATNAKEIISLLKKWRSSPENARIVEQKGFGYGGQVLVFTAKIVPCNNIPAYFRYPTNPPMCDDIGKSGKTHMDEALEFWTWSCSAFSYHEGTDSCFGNTVQNTVRRMMMDQKQAMKAHPAYHHHFRK